MNRSERIILVPTNTQSSLSMERQFVIDVSIIVTSNQSFKLGRIKLRCDSNGLDSMSFSRRWLDQSSIWSDLSSVWLDLKLIWLDVTLFVFWLDYATWRRHGVKKDSIQCEKKAREREGDREILSTCLVYLATGSSSLHTFGMKTEGLIVANMVTFQKGWPTLVGDHWIRWV